MYSTEDRFCLFEGFDFGQKWKTLCWIQWYTSESGKDGVGVAAAAAAVMVWIGQVTKPTVGGSKNDHGGWSRV
jgi:hypothetical protein